MLYEIAVKSPLRKLFTYESDQVLTKGMRVRVPFRSREVPGIVWGVTEQSPKGLKSIVAVEDSAPILPQEALLFYERLAAYYGLSIGELLASALPESLSVEKAHCLETKHFVPLLPTLTQRQTQVVQAIQALEGYQVHLIQGETGSGKTEVYAHLFDKVISEGGQALFLVPEISLTPQLCERLQQRMGGAISVFHSQAREKVRREIVARALSGRADIFLGARSAALLPFTNLKLIVVDEEHDASYKQNERGLYHARDAAVLRAHDLKIPLVLGSATPSLESLERVTRKESHYYRLPAFHEKQKAPLEIVDLKHEWAEGNKTFISEALHEAVTQELQEGRQSLLFLNRRGSASQRLCVSCGHVDECKHCAVKLTYHHDFRRLVCHWCGFQKRESENCQECQGKEFFFGGIGTKQIESEMRTRFPDARIARLDRDEVKKLSDLERIVRDFAEGRIDILIGTQMISKGIDIARLSLVGVILADQGWSVPDFRGNERAFQLLLQLEGRGGRRGQKSRFLVQTFQKDNPIFQWLRASDPVNAFVEAERPIRQMADLPPFSKMALITLSHREGALLKRESILLQQRLSQMAKGLEILIVGPTPAPLFRWKNLYREQILIKDRLKGSLSSLLLALYDDLDRLKLKSKVRIDRDPQSFL